MEIRWVESTCAITGPCWVTTSVENGTSACPRTLIEYEIGVTGMPFTHGRGAAVQGAPSVSMYRSVTSYPTTVTPHPTCLPRPISAPGTPGKEPPIRLRPLLSLAVMAARWNSSGYCSCRCGSLATIACPVADLSLCTTQL